MPSQTQPPTGVVSAFLEVIKAQLEAVSSVLGVLDARILLEHASFQQSTILGRVLQEKIL